MLSLMDYVPQQVYDFIINFNFIIVHFYLYLKFNSIIIVVLINLTLIQFLENFAILQHYFFIKKNRL